MNDGSSDNGSNNSLRHEWSILVQSFIEDDSLLKNKVDKNQKLMSQLKSQGLKFDDLKAYAKQLSLERKSINNQIEDIKKLIESKQQTIENLNLVKSDPTDVLAEIEELNHIGEQLSKKMNQIETKSKTLRLAETLFQSENEAP